MRKRSFEQLSRAMMDLLYKIQDEASLLKLAHGLLQAKTTALISCRMDKAGTINRTVSGVYPQRYSKLFGDTPSVLWDWYAGYDPNLIKHGYTYDKSLSIEQETFPGAFVVSNRHMLKQHEAYLELMVLLDLGEVKNRTPITWTAQNLLLHYNFIKQNLENGKQIKSAEIKNQTLEETNKELARVTGQNVLPDLFWDQVKGNPYREVKWIFYQIEKMICQKEPKPIWQAFQKYTENQMTELVCDLQSLPSFLGRYLLQKNEGSLLEEDRIEDLKKILNTENFFDSQNRSNTQIFCLFLRYAWWDVLSRVSLEYDTYFVAAKWSKDNISDTCPNLESEVKKENKDKEIEARKSVQKQLFHKLTKDTDPLDKKIRALLDLTHYFLVCMLASKSISEEKSKKLNKWGREELRLYFGLELSTSKSSLSQLYLKSEPDKEHRCASLFLRQAYAISLSRFMISILRICLSRFDFFISHSFVTPSEELDSLLHMVDRFAHVEIGVTEEINFRKLLGRQIAAEVHQHLASPYYRDHLLHVIDVFLLGHLILNTQISWIERIKQPLVEHFCRLSTEKKSEQLLTQRHEWFRNWAVASLLHDIGYQIGHKDHITHRPRTWEEYFSLNTNDSPEELHLDWRKLPAIGDDGDKSKGETFLRELYQSISNVSHSCKAMLSPEEDHVTDHGMISALRVAQILLHTINHHEKDISKLDDSLISKYYHAVHAIANHNLHSAKMNLHDHPLTCILRLCDELQEWDRRRVNVEKMVKGLYLDIQEGIHEDLLAYEILDSFYANIKLVHEEGGNGNKWHLEWTPKGSSHSPVCSFKLVYRDAVTANFDPMITLLQKAFCFQNLDMVVDPQRQNEIRIEVETEFPKPVKYGDLQEYDIYCLFTEEIRDLPLLEEEENVSRAFAGLVRIRTRRTEKVERFAMVIQSRSENRLGLLALDPGQFRKQYDTFKEKLISIRRQG